MLRPDQQQWAVEHSELMQSIAKTEIQVAGLRRFAALTPETVAAVKHEASAKGRVAYEALEGNAARIADGHEMEVPSLSKWRPLRWCDERQELSSDNEFSSLRRNR